MNDYNGNMTSLIALDDDNGKSFLGKRLSSDREIINKIVTMFPKTDTDERSSSHIREEQKMKFRIRSGECPAFWSETGEIQKQSDTLIVFRWNRRYAADEYYNPAEHGWELVSAEDFPGHSHEKITMETYRKSNSTI